MSAHDMKAFLDMLSKKPEWQKQLGSDVKENDENKFITDTINLAEKNGYHITEKDVRENLKWGNKSSPELNPDELGQVAGGYCSTTLGPIFGANC